MYTVTHGHCSWLPTVVFCYFKIYFVQSSAPFPACTFFLICLYLLRFIFIFTVIRSPHLCQIKLQLNRTMIRSHHFRMNLRIHQAGFQRFRHSEIINPPSRIFLSCFKPIGPPAVDTFCFRIKITVRINKALFRKLCKLCPLLIRKPCVFAICLWIF